MAPKAKTSFGSACSQTSRMYFPLFSKLNWAVTWSCTTDLSKSCDTVCLRAVMLVCHFKFLLWWDRTKEITHSPTSMVPWLWFNLAETTLAWPPQAGGQAQQTNLVKAPMVEAECEENPAQRKWQEAQCAGNQDSEIQTQHKAHTAQSHIPEDLQLRQEVLAPVAGGTHA